MLAGLLFFEDVELPSIDFAISALSRSRGVISDSGFEGAGGAGFSITAFAGLGSAGDAALATDAAFATGVLPRLGAVAFATEATEAAILGSGLALVALPLPLLFSVPSDSRDTTGGYPAGLAAAV